MGYYYENVESKDSSSALVYYRRKGSEGGSYPLHWHKDIEIDLVIDGDIDAVVDGVSTHIGKDDFLFVNSGVLHETSARDELLMESVTVIISYRLIKEYCPDIKNYRFEIKDGSVKKRISELIRECGYEEDEKREYYRLRLDILVRKILDILLTECLVPNSDNNFSGNIVSVRHAMAFIEENFRKDITLTAVSDEAGLTPTYFSRYFRKMTGQTFHDYLTRVRLYNAHSLLCTGDETVSLIAKKSGFKNVKSFIEAFKKAYGETPERYRKKISSEKI